LFGGQPVSLSLRGAFLKVVGDLLGWLAVMAASIMVVTTRFALGRSDRLGTTRSAGPARCGSRQETPIICP
jgi:Co/Zn/Cd efflux system component